MTFEDAAAIVGLAPFTVKPERQKLVAAQSTAREDWIEEQLSNHSSTRAFWVDEAHDLEEAAERIARALMAERKVIGMDAIQGAFDGITDSVTDAPEIFRTTFNLIAWELAQ